MTDMKHPVSPGPGTPLSHASIRSCHSHTPHNPSHLHQSSSSSSSSSWYIMLHHVTSGYRESMVATPGPITHIKQDMMYPSGEIWWWDIMMMTTINDETWCTLPVRLYEPIILVRHGTQPMLVFCSICVWCIFCILLLGRWCPICDFPNADAVDGGNICIVSMAMLQHCIFYKLISISAKINWFIDLLLFYRNDLSRPSQH